MESAVDTVVIYHNPRCSKSRQALALLVEHGVEPQIVEYLKTPLSKNQLKALAKSLGVQDARDMMRRKERQYAELALDGAAVSQEALFEAMANHPELMERPIVAVGKKARVGRPPEAILALLD
jgi:arsenate reductase